MSTFFPASPQPHRHKKQRILLGALLILVVILSTIVWRRYRLITISLADQQLAPETGLVAVTDTNLSPALLTFYRFNDGEKQTFPGTFQYRFAKRDRALVFGVPQSATSSQYFIVLEPKQAQLKKIISLPGPILEATPSTNGIFVLLSGVVTSTLTISSSRTYYSCVVLASTFDYHDCEFIDRDILQPNLKNTFDKQAIYSTAWHPNLENVLLISESGQNGRLFSYNAVTHKFTDSTTSSLQIARDLELAKTTKPSYATRHLGPFTWLTTKKGLYNLWLPLGTTVTALNDTLALAEDSDSLWIIDLPNHTKSLITSLPPRTKRTVQWFQQ